MSGAKQSLSESLSKFEEAMARQASNRLTQRKSNTKQSLSENLSKLEKEMARQASNRLAQRKSNTVRTPQTTAQSKPNTKSNATSPQKRKLRTPEEAMLERKGVRRTPHAFLRKQDVLRSHQELSRRRPAFNRSLYGTSEHIDAIIRTGRFRRTTRNGIAKILEEIKNNAKMAQIYLNVPPPPPPPKRPRRPRKKFHEGGLVRTTGEYKLLKGEIVISRGQRKNMTHGQIVKLIANYVKK